jgi:hypothetical protein
VGTEPYGSAPLSNYYPPSVVDSQPHSLMSTLGRTGPPLRCGGLSPRPPRRVGLDRGSPRPLPRVGLRRPPPSLRHVGLGLHSPCSSSVYWVGLHSPSSSSSCWVWSHSPSFSSSCSDRCCCCGGMWLVRLVIAVVEVVAMVMVVMPRDRHRCRYALSMGARCCRWVVSVVIEGSGRGKKTKTNHEISWFASLHTGGASVLLVSSTFVVVVASLLFLLLLLLVSPLTSPFLRLAPASPPHRCVILRIHPSSTSSLQPSSLSGSPRSSSLPGFSVERD